MDTPADFSVVDTNGARTLSLNGDWTAICLGDAAKRLQEIFQGEDRVDLNAAGRFDTAGALGLLRAAGDSFDIARVAGRPETLRLLDRVYEATKLTTPKRRGACRSTF